MTAKVPSEVLKRVANWRQQGDKIVFTSGVFDIVHVGHLRLLSEASHLGDRLIVAVNTDESVKRKKGPNRPINTLDRRVEFLTNLRSVDIAFPFDSESEHPLDQIREIRPDVVAKSGGEWNEDNYFFRDIVAEHGGRAEILQHTDGISTSLIIEKILSVYSNGK